MEDQKGLFPQSKVKQMETKSPRKKEWSPRMVGGYDFGEVASAMQKSIRRGMEFDAVYWAYILYKSGFSKYLKRRVNDVIQEDIGIANPNAMIMGMLLKLDAQTKKSDPKYEKAEFGGDGFTPILNTISLACRGKKTRMSDSLLNLVVDGVDKWGLTDEMKIPEYAIDPHTTRGKEIHGRWEAGTREESHQRIKNWFDTWAKLENEEEGLDIYKEQLKEKWGYYDKSKSPISSDRK